ncbi:hypothetical protein N9E25_15680 [Verrucomicrobiales bacterium]|nr:hypothetical protein [Verrucomicrobiales bacterium]MDB2496122.1 hypothetical protein [Verrucomicrobiales bacterium]
MSQPSTKILYCRCAFAKVIPEGTKNEVLERLCESGESFECVADLCEMSARRDDRIKQLLSDGQSVKIAACYPRAVKWLFHQAEAPFPDGDSVEVLNMREQSADEIIENLTQK